MKQIDIKKLVMEQFGLSDQEADKILKVCAAAIRFTIGGGSSIHIDDVMSVRLHPDIVKNWRKKIGRNNRTIEKILAGKRKANIFVPKIVSKYGKR